MDSKKKKKVQLVNLKEITAFSYVEIYKCVGLFFFLLLPFAFVNLPVTSGQAAKTGVGHA